MPEYSASMLSYLVQLTADVSSGLALHPAAWRRQHADFIRNQQQPDGGFCGRDSGGDLYYTSFALRSLAVLDELDEQTATRAAEFLCERLSGEASIVDFFSLIYGATLLDMAAGKDVFSGVASTWRTDVAQALEKLRRPDGGYAKTDQGAASSTYHTFLMLICLQMLEQPIPRPNEVAEFLLSQECEGGGFREIRLQKRAGTNPTAAAVAALRVLGVSDDVYRDQTCDFLLEMQTDEGGLRANTRIPIADLLSTFTGVLTLLHLGAGDELNLSSVMDYARSLEGEQGGFRGAAWDTVEDVEYTFYGLGCAALVAAAGDRQG